MFLCVNCVYNCAMLNVNNKSFIHTFIHSFLQYFKIQFNSISFKFFFCGIMPRAVSLLVSIISSFGSFIHLLLFLNCSHCVYSAMPNKATCPHLLPDDHYDQ